MTASKKVTISKSQSQIEKFKAMAKEVGADGDEKALDKNLKKLAGKPAK